MLFAVGRKVVALAREEATSCGKRKRMWLADSTRTRVAAVPASMLVADAAPV